MSSSDRTNNRGVLSTYTAAIFVSALLLFSVQPLFAKMVLPRLGGSPAVWSVAMVFFQTLLLAGYAYAHWLASLRRRQASVAIHLALLVAAFMTLPLAIADGWGRPPSEGTALWLIGLFTVSIGLPFFALAANSPLLQAWFVRTGHPSGHDPYFLYASSNIGSFLALLSYPFLLEPMLTLQTQIRLWSVGFAVLMALIALCAVLMLRGAKQTQAAHAGAATQDDTPAPAWRTRLRWIFLAAVPSGLLIAVTAHISTDVAAAPLMWVLPLSLYLLTWVLVFQSKPLLPHRYMLLMMPLAIALSIMLLTSATLYNLPATLGGHLLSFFVIAMACHGELARTRPPARHLTGFYVALSFGGMVGGLFAGLLAPYAFSWIAEYPILIAAAVLCRPTVPEPAQGWRRWFWPLFALVALLAVLPAWLGGEWFAMMEEKQVSVVAIMAVAAMLVLIFFKGSNAKGLAAVVLALALLRLYPAEDGRVETVRSFFGVHKIVTTPDGKYRVLMHGTTIHGAEKIDPNPPEGEKPQAISYYHRDSGMGQVAPAMRAKKGGPIRGAVIGLGAGALACSIAPGENWTFFEIDPSMIATARDPKYFTFVQRCAPNLKIVVGDARLTFADEPDGTYDLIIVDAYSSDAIPVHLATKEAMAIYKRKLAPGGVVLMHVSNRNLELTSVAVGIADANGLKSWVSAHDLDRSGEYIFASTVVLSAKDEADIGELAESKLWELTAPTAGQRVWTDDYSNVLGAVWRQLRDH